MLYLSRLVGFAAYGVVDTDDGVEEEILHQTLVETIEKYGISINGVTSHYGILNFSPWQDPDTLTKLQIKTKLVSGIDIIMYRDIITNISFDECKSQAWSIRLSDFGKSCADNIFAGNKSSVDRSVTVILDDKIQVTDYSLLRPDPFVSLGNSGVGLKFDLREVRNIRHMIDIYWQLIVNRFLPLEAATDLDILDSVIDSERRKDFIGELIDEYVDVASADMKNIRKSPEYFKQQLQANYKEWFKKFGWPGKVV